MARIRWLTFLMFLMFAMTSESVGVIIPAVIREFGLGMASGGAFHYATMSGIALGGGLLGTLADRLGRKTTILIGLAVFGISALLFAWASSFAVFLILLFVGGLAVGLFKTGALALIGDITISTREHTATMNMVEGFFGIGAIIGPAIVAYLLAKHASWTWLYLIAAVLCGLLFILAWWVPYPPARARTEGARGVDMLRLIDNRYVLGFGACMMLYVGVETAIYVWMPTLLAGYAGSGWQAAGYALSAFFVLRVVGRFSGFWLIHRYSWTTVLALCGVAILACFAGSLIGGRRSAVFLLPASGLFMSVIYPTLNSKGISCFPKAAHGAVSGLLLFFTCLSAVVSPLTMGMIGDRFGDAIYGFYLATGFAAILAAGLVLNRLFDPTRVHLARREDDDYGFSPGRSGRSHGDGWN